ncbi:MAG: Spo0B domain-containing protein [Clostridia bacterium]|nr:Spo0B domain-containing protein [Clostridia bacterium]
MRKPSRQIDVHKNAWYAIIINSVQIAAVWALAILLIIEHDLWISIATFVIAVIVTIGAAVDIREAFLSRRKSDEADTLTNMVSQMDALNRTLRAQRHDFLNHLQVVFSLIEMEEYQEASDYIEKVYGDMQSVSRAMRTDNPAINALLRAKIASCEQAGIQVTLHALGSWKNLPMPAWEMCRVFSNIIDNAADALKNTTEKQLSISLKEDLHGFSFSVSNNGPMIPPQIARSIFDAGVSSHGEGRGMGLYIVRTTIENYGGNITVHSDAAQTTFAGFIPHMKEQNGQQEQKNQSA